MEEEIKEPENNNKFAELEKKRDEYLNNWKRAAADMANYKKDEMERAGLLITYAKEDMFYNLLPIIDSMYLAAAAFGKDGFEPVEKQIQEFLKKEGIEEIEVMGKPFNPETMESIASQSQTDADQTQTNADVVVEELQKGYMMNGKVVRPAKVKVSK